MKLKRWLRMGIMGCALVILLSAPALAYKKDTDVPYPATGGSIYFDKNTGTVTSGDYSVTEAVIPREIEGVTVTSIERSAFAHCSNLTSVTLPDTLTSIGENAFEGCGLISVAIPDSVTQIGKYAFLNCIKLTSVKLSSGLSTFEETFYHCASLISVTIPDGVTAIGEGAFSGCHDLQTVDIPNSVTTIGTTAFAGCGLTSLTIPDSVTTIGVGAFLNCMELDSLTIPSSIQKIERQAFYGCGFTRVSISSGITEIEPEVFSHCIRLLSIEIPGSVTRIGKWAFCACDALTSVVIPSGVTVIEEEAFYSCDRLASVTLPKTVTSIGLFAFSMLENLKDVYYEGTKEQFNAIDGLESSDLLSENLGSYYIGNVYINPFERRSTVHYNIALPEASKPETPELNFTDVPKDSYFYSPVLWATRTGITGGTSPTTFSPHDTCTVAQVLTFLWRANLSPEPDIRNPFINISTDSYYAKAAVWAYEEELIEGNVFPANDPCTRGMAVMYLWRLNGSPRYFYDANHPDRKDYTGEHPFTDVPEGSYYDPAVAWALYYRVTQGTSDTTFSPDWACSRAQIVTLLYRSART